ncbi:hypothetical protein BO70DRAFT_372751 [Aspergillus heteromorphus CBS 117.55]|uniref:ADP-ribosylation n=1 Tax=Aspergillus heteromorphus CBS 117.55 TaxID=1448321 RepID=A0A317VMF4_9EURO|nr:uncharacterized protein BO70DRAFT_372751 [Aspergillus heteromorphus CBS 117.55]PWY75543.1 hypothetical protein BO70DRAFT_372751 [Aspergillus heteromorphus CBS 117.55]
MHFPSITNLLLIALATWTAASPINLEKRGDIVVGFRRVSKEQAEEYNKKGLYFDHDFEMWGKQIGKGVYTSPSRDEYEQLSDPKNWYCVIKSPSHSFASIPKAWIPEKNPSNQKRLWNQLTESHIDEYVKGLGEDPDKALRLSIMPHGRDRTRTQMLIVPDLATHKHFSVRCYEKKEDVKEGRVDYGAWGVKGEKGT